MKVGIVNSQSKINQKSQYSFQHRQTQSAITFCAFTSGNTQPPILTTLRQIINVLNRGKVVQKPRNNVVSTQEIKNLAANLKSKDANIQSLALKKIFKSYAASKSENDAISKFVWNEMLPYVKEQDDAKLTNLVLKVHKKVTPQSDLSIIDRIKIIQTIGNKSHIAELESYTGKQSGISNSVKLDEDFRENSIKRAAFQALLNML